MAKKEIKKTAQNLVMWLLTRILGLLITACGFYLIAVFYYYSATDSYYGFNSTEETRNVMGFVGGYISGTLLNYLDISSYLIAIACLFWGAKLSIGLKINNKILRIILLILSVLITISLYVNFSFYENIVGQQLHELFLAGFYKEINNDLIILTIEVIVAAILIPTILYALTIKNYYLFFIGRNLYKAIRYFFVIVLRVLVYFFKTKKDNVSISRQDPQIDDFVPKKEFEKNEPKINIKKRVVTSDPNQINLAFNEKIEYEIPKLNLLKTPVNKNVHEEDNNRDYEKKAKQLEEVLSQFGIQGKVRNVSPGPIVTMYELEPSAGTKSSRIINLADDIARSISALSVRISSQPGRNIIGIELPNNKRSPVYLSELLSHENYVDNDGNLVLALGKNIAGIPITADLEKMPHLLIAGTTGSGKSVGINSMIISLLFKYKPSECRFILIDPKMLELSIYEDIPHLMAPVVTNPHKAIVALKWAVKEMESRYRLMNHASVKNITSYNNKISDLLQSGKKMYREVTTGIDPDTGLQIVEKQEIPNENFPYIVIIIDEMADLMMVAGKDVEIAIQRLAQMARAAGIHLIMATQRPSVDVITGTIKANFTSRISYHVASKFDSRTIINEMGAEQLLGSGDMLFMENGGKITRLHGGLVSETEIGNVVRFIKKQSKPDFSKDITAEKNLSSDNMDFNSNSEIVDELYSRAVQIIISEQKASTSFIQRHLQIGYNRAARIIEKMEKDGIVSEANHVGKREVLKNK